MKDSQEVVRDYYRDQGRLSMLEEIMESLEAGHAQLSGAYRDGYLAAMESVTVKAKPWGYGQDLTYVA